MKINKNLKLEAVAAKPNDYRGEALSSVLIEGDKAVATNGHAMAVVKIEREDGDTDGLIPQAALKEARKLTAKRDENATLSVNGKVVLSNNATFERPDAQFPHWKECLPKENSVPCMKIGINPKLLVQLAEALGTDQYVAIEVYDTHEGQVTSAMVVKKSYEANDKEANFGLIMPVRL